MTSTILLLYIIPHSPRIVPQSVTMSLNDINLSNETAKSTTTYASVANPTKSGKTDPVSANFVDNPATPTIGAGGGAHLDAAKHAARLAQHKNEAGVVEARPGIIESTNIDPLNENSNKDDGWANAKSSTPRASDPAKSYVSSAADVVSGTAKLAYGHLTGDEQTKKEGQHIIYGK
ncbi:hypothetical protein BDN70DRAFT_645183 [Pholiota conissans]|uniref:Uncharacterized protein n=1 Tax=Pholiota conissans TaxID=109636 RepID=A0A9P6D187_9AGAR|nr:hypothetical protein BDN70DRAFT_645183 [Pholiota conissans]